MTPQSLSSGSLNTKCTKFLPNKQPDKEVSTEPRKGAVGEWAQGDTENVQTPTGMPTTRDKL